MGRYRIFLVAALFLLLYGSACAFELGSKNFLDNPVPARMLYPKGETASLQGKSALEFQWSDPIPVNTGGFEFRLYKGYDSTEPNLIKKENLDRDAGVVSVGADKFENGQVYTWTLKRISDDGRKSDQVYNSFTVVK